MPRPEGPPQFDMQQMQQPTRVDESEGASLGSSDTAEPAPLGQRLIDDVTAASSPIPELTQPPKYETPEDPLVRRAVIRGGTIIYEVSRKSQIPNDWK